MKAKHIHVTPVIIKQHHEELWLDIKSPFMKARNISVAHVTIRQHKVEVLQGIKSCFMQMHDLKHIQTIYNKYKVSNLTKWVFMLLNENDVVRLFLDVARYGAYSLVRHILCSTK